MRQLLALLALTLAVAADADLAETAQRPHARLRAHARKLTESGGEDFGDELAPVDISSTTSSQTSATSPSSESTSTSTSVLSSTTTSTTSMSISCPSWDDADRAAADAAADAAQLQQKAQAAGETFCASISALLAEASSLSSQWASEFACWSQLGRDAGGATAAAANAWATVFQTFAQEWAAGGAGCQSELLNISAATVQSSEEWAHSYDGYGGIAAASSVSSCNHFAETYRNIALAWGSSHMSGAAGCDGLDLWSDMYKELLAHMVSATVPWTGHFAGPQKAASAAWSVAVQKFAEVLHVSSSAWADACETEDVATAEAASEMILENMRTFDAKMTTASEDGWARVFMSRAPCDGLCFAAAASLANDWTASDYLVHFAATAGRWAAVFPANSSEAEAAGAQWASFFKAAATSAAQRSAVWSRIYRTNSLDLDTLLPVAASTSNKWAYFFQVLASSIQTAAQGWAAASCSSSSSMAWSLALKGAAEQLQVAQAAWARRFRRSATETALGASAAASNAWSLAIVTLSASMKEVAREYALCGDVHCEDHQAASDKWAAAFTQLTWTASDAAWAWADAFHRPEQPTEAEYGAIVSASDSMAHLFQEVSASATAAGLAWSAACEACESQWAFVIDFLVLSVDSSQFGESAVARWMAALGVTIAPPSWQHAASEINADRGEFTASLPVHILPVGLVSLGGF
eukprot:CAMPEP_0178465242 /NCGR_PEP_ID=MMETSP0689_2-20121128/51255_1 /TAXON_ID=160604 /ORGANISM="Amphidinium massartii, Strain CS-259" /LENGTH=695 /DNA_ID=CAMNT_0020092165 /DNA_START=12 /DNA_END=2099 /DNA_ORIENTATION=+